MDRAGEGRTLGNTKIREAVEERLGRREDGWENWG